MALHVTAQCPTGARASIIVDFKFNETARAYAEKHGYGGGLYGECGMYAMREYAQYFTLARGIGLIEINGADDLLPAEPGNTFHGHECERIRRQVNAEAARAEFERLGIECWDWRGHFAFDASSALARALADQIGASLASYPVLDEERLSEREWEAARALVKQEINLPEGIDADDVIGMMPEVRYCPSCGTSGIEDAMNALGYAECVSCHEWLKTDTDNAVCYACAEAEAEPDCECVPAYIEVKRGMNEYPAKRAIHEILRGCERCYAALHPHGHQAPLTQPDVQGSIPMHDPRTMAGQHPLPFPRRSSASRRRRAAKKGKRP